MRMLGLDVGERRIGVAICDYSGLLATPYTAIVRREPEERRGDHRQNRR